MSIPLWPHQQKTVDFYKSTPLIFDTSSPGTGKTRSHLHALSLRPNSQALIIAPKTLVNSVWVQELKSYFPNVPYQIINTKTISLIPSQIYITNVDNVVPIATKIKTRVYARLLQSTDTLIVDESTAFKHRTSQRSKSLSALTKILPLKYKILMTGTPSTRSITDIWHQIYLLDHGERLGTSFSAFQYQVCTPKQNGYGVVWEDKEGINTIVHALIKDISIRHDFQDVMDLPPNMTRKVIFLLPPKLRLQYTQLKRQSILDLEALSEPLTVTHAAALRNKLLQLLSGAIYVEGSAYTVLDHSRYELIADLIEEREKSVVFYMYQHQREEILRILAKRSLPARTILSEDSSLIRERKITEFQTNPYIRAMLLHPLTGAHGLTLTAATATIWASPTSLPDYLTQGVHRVYRGGQTKPTENILIEAPDTIEPHIYDVLSGRLDRMNDLLWMLKN